MTPDNVDMLLLENQLFLEDYNEYFQYQLIESAKEGKEYYIRGIVSKAGVLNKNKRIYPQQVMSEAIQSILPDVEKGRFVGELDHPPTPKINVNKISHRISKIAMAPDGTVISEMVVLDTPEGLILKKLIDGKVGLGVSTRATGGVKPAFNLGEGVVEVLPGLKMRAIDVVFDPSAGDQYGRPNFFAESVITEGGIILTKTPTLSQLVDELFGR